MAADMLTRLGQALRSRRQARHLTQPQLAERVARSRTRISEMESDLLNGRPSKDRLGLLLEVCDALDLEPVLVPRDRLGVMRRLLAEAPSTTSNPTPRPLFEDLFVDLGDDDDATREVK